MSTLPNQALQHKVRSCHGPALLGAGQSESEWPNNYAKEDYESPELVLARMAGELGSTVNLPAQDMWALGACLLKLLTGRLVCRD